MNKENVFALLVIVLVISMAGFQVSLGKKAGPKTPPSGEAVFKSSCEQCHPGGGNSVHPTKPVAGSEMLTSLAIFKSYLTSPLGHMPYYKHIVSDEPTLKALYDYCKSLKPTQQTKATDPPLS